jgi:3-phenylpropionate/trans-cinnamate dioxygenase ferredoxin reductase component
MGGDRIVIAGAGLAGLRAAEALREHSFTGEIVIVGDERHRPYNRPPLSKGVLVKGTTDIGFPIDNNLGATWKLGVSAAHLDVPASTLTLSDGSRLNYDGLIVATGSCAVRPRVPGADLPGVFVLRTLDDAISLSGALARKDKVAIIGAGLVGCEIAASAMTLGKSVTLIDAEPLPMLRVLGHQLGGVIAAIHRFRGVDIQMQNALSKIDKTEHGFSVVLANGKTIQSEIVVLATGGAPNCDWLKASSLVVDKGLRCDSRCFALGGGERVVAAGDVARWNHPAYDTPIRVEHWTNAGEQAAAAAAALLDPSNAQPFCPLLSFWTDQYGQRLQGIGAPWLGTKVVFTKGTAEDSKFVAVALRDERVVGAGAMNMPAGLIDWRARIGETYV